MAHRTNQSDATAAKSGSLSMQIYKAMLGDEPSFEGTAPASHPRLKMRLKVEARLEHAGSSPFFRTTLREHVERYAAYAARALEEARERLTVSRPKPIETLGAPAARELAKPVVLVGKAGAKHRPPSGSRAA